MEKKYKLYNRLLGLISFIGASIVYLLTIEPTVSLWDCGEFIATAGKLEVGHPPGAPFFLLLGRFFSLFASSPEQVAACVNTMSALASGATIMFLFWTITHLAKKFFNESELSLTNIVVILSAGLIGAGAYTFTDTFWFSAVEGEVYGMSSFLTAVVFWAILEWEDHFDEPGNGRWLILIAYIMGLSIGVHLLNLLTITAIVYVYYFKKFKTSIKGIIFAGLLSFVFIAFMMWGIIAGSINVAAQFELFCVNTLGLPFQSGLIAWLILLIISFIIGVIITKNDTVNQWVKVILITFITLLLGIPFLFGSALGFLVVIAAIIAGLYYVNKYDKYALNTITNILMVIMIGYSSYAMIILRSNANTPMNENGPKNVFSLLSYLNREQYGQTPLLYGPYYNAVPKINSARTDYEKKINYTYTPRGDKYIKIENSSELVYEDEMCTFFPRMYDSGHEAGYKNWAGIEDGKNTKPYRSKTDGEKYNVPTFGQNLRYFLSYQVGHMYFRYFMWNFCGRQDDIQGDGSIMHGNWISGINFIDSNRLGDQTYISEKARNIPSRNVYYGIPLILGLIGFFYHCSKKSKDSFVVTLLFLMTGLAIILYLNQKPAEPRERDYAYAGSFYAYCIWIGLCVLAIFEGVKKLLAKLNLSYQPHIIAVLIAILVTIPAPILLATQNWDDHDRSGRYTAHDFAYNYLQSCDQNGMIVTAGDNDTFPLWYIQEIEGVRTDVRVLCSPLLATDWYAQQMKHQAYESAPLPMKLTEEQVGKGIRDYALVKPIQGYRKSLKEAMDTLRSNKKWRNENYLLGSQLRFDVDSNLVIKNNVVTAKDYNKICKSIDFNIDKGYIMKDKIVLYDCLDDYQWDRPLYFTSMMSAYETGLHEYLRFDGFAYKFVPIKNTTSRKYIDSDVLYDKLMNVYQWRSMGEKGVYIDHFHERTTRVIGIREMFNNLADQLIKEQKIDSAKNVLDKLCSIMPDWQFPYFDDEVITTAYLYYQINEAELATKELETYAENLCDEIEWYNSLDKEFWKDVHDTKTNYTLSLMQIYYVADYYHQEDFCKKLEERWKGLEKTSLKEHLTVMSNVLYNLHYQPNFLPSMDYSPKDYMYFFKQNQLGTWKNWSISEDLKTLSASLSSNSGTNSLDDILDMYEEYVIYASTPNDKEDAMEIYKNLLSVQASMSTEQKKRFDEITKKFNNIHE